MDDVDEYQRGSTAFNNSHINNADVLLKLVNIAGTPNLKAQDCDDFSGLVCRLLCGGIAEGYEDNTSDAATLRDYIDTVCDVLDDAVNPSTNGNTINPVSTLSVAMVDMMRTSSFCLMGDDIEARKEYTRGRCSIQNQQKGELWRILRSQRITPENRQAYSIAESMSANFTDGIDALRQLHQSGDEYLIHYINNAAPHLVRNLECMLFPTLFDGQRLFAGISIAARFFGVSSKSYGVNFMARHVLNANSSLISLFRVQATFCAFLAMARIHIVEEKDDDWEHLIEAIDTLVDDMDIALKSKFGAEGSRRDAPASIAAAFACIASWFDRAVQDDVLYRILQSAFKAPVLVLGEACPALCRRWSECCRDNSLSAVSMWTAVQFLITSRREMHASVMPISTAVHVILAGVVGNCVAAFDINGPFILSNDAKLYTSVYYKKLPRVNFSLPDFDTFMDGGVCKNPTRDGSRDCKDTKIIKMILDKGRVRGQHEKGRLVETRLCASLPFLSIKEALMRDLPKGVSASPSEGRKDLRRLYIKYLQTLPSCKHRRSHNQDQGSYMTARRRSGETGQTTSDNVEKPWRDIIGGSIISTFLSPLAGEAFMYTLEAIVDDQGKFTSNTNKCVQLFAENLNMVSGVVFDPETAMQGAPDRLEGRDYALRILSHQRAFSNAFCKLINMESGALWEALQLTFSMHNKKEFDADDVRDTLPHLPPLPMPISLPPLPTTSTTTAVSPRLPPSDKRKATEQLFPMAKKHTLMDPDSPSCTF